MDSDALLVDAGGGLAVELFVGCVETCVAAVVAWLGIFGTSDEATDVGCGEGLSASCVEVDGEALDIATPVSVVVVTMVALCTTTAPPESFAAVGSAPDAT